MGQANFTKSRIATLEDENAKWGKIFPDHCYRCEKPCLYAGSEADTGAQRCADCLLKDSRAENAELRGEVGRLKAQEAPTCPNCGGPASPPFKCAKADCGGWEE